MTKEQAIKIINDLIQNGLTNFGGSEPLSAEEIDAFEIAIKALEQNNEVIFKQFKKKVFLESEDVLGNEMVDSYMITDYLAELMGVEND